MSSLEQMQYRRALAEMHMDKYKVPGYCDLSQKDLLVQPEPEVIDSVFGKSTNLCSITV